MYIKIAQEVLARPCPRPPPHDGERFTHFCLEPLCRTRLLCSVCLFLDHRDHKVVPLKLYLARIGGRASGHKDTREMVALAVLLEYGRASCQSILREEDNRCIRQFVFNYFDRLQYHLSQLDQLAKQLVAVTEQVPSLPRLEEILTSHFTSQAEISRFSQDKIQLQKKLKRLRSLLHFKQPLKSLIAMNLFSQRQELPRINFFFGQMIGSCLSLTGSTVLKKSNEVKCGVALAQPALNFFGWQKTGVGFLIHNCSQVCIGICQGEAMRKSKYQLSYKLFNQENPSSMNHPLVAISNYGYSWSYLLPDQNYQFVGFNFQANDLVYVVLNPATDKLVFTVGDLSYSLSVPRHEEGDWHFMAAVGGFSNSVELINEVPLAILNKH